MMRSFGRATLFAATVWVSQATAATIIADITGTVASGLDAGYFSPAGTDLTGSTFEALFTFDTDQGQLFATPAAYWLIGGIAWGGASPGHADLTVAGQILHIDGSAIASIVESANGSTATHTLGAQGSVVPTPKVFFGFAESPFLKADLKATFDGDPCIQTIECSGSFSTLEFAPTHYSLQVIGDFAVPPTPPTGHIPEPSTWAMMLVGFFGLGAAVRCRRAATAPR